jgi:DeoR/GlpR family transcriptional regulator of sugar metabolism
MGGAVPISPALADCRTREHVEPESKARVARRAAELIHPGDPVILDGGTTTLARRVLLGGRVYKHSAVTRDVTGIVTDASPDHPPVGEITTGGTQVVLADP